MEESKALHKLLEATDLIGLIEEMLNPQQVDRMSQTALSGMRITLRNARESIQASHGILSGDLLARSRASISAAVSAQTNGDHSAAAEKAPKIEARSETTIVRSQASLGGADSMRTSVISRKDLKASLEKFIEK